MKLRSILGALLVSVVLVVLALFSLFCYFILPLRGLSLLLRAEDQHWNF